MNRFECGIFISISCLLLSGCSATNKYNDIDKLIATMKQTESMKQQGQVPNVEQAPKPITYQSNQMRSPFNKEAPKVANKVGSHTNPLQAYPLNVLRLVGIVSEGEVSTAFVMTPDNLLYEVKVGDLIGDQSGKVVKIVPNRIDVMEEGSTKKNGASEIVSLQLKEGNQ